MTPPETRLEAATGPEEKAILLCAGMQPERKRLDGLSAILGNTSFRWEKLVRLALEHGMLPLLHEHLSKLGKTSIPSSSADFMEAQLAFHTWRCIQLVRLLLQLTAQLERRGIQAVAFKGPLVATVAYERMTLRPFSDLDLLVPDRSLPSLCDSFLEWGYEMSGGSILQAGHYGFVGQESFRVEVHTPTAITAAWGSGFDFSGALDRLQPQEVWGCRISSFSPEDHFLLLCLHGDKHCWKGVRWIGDIARILTRARLDWPLVLTRARSGGLENVLALAAGLARDLLEARVPPELEPVAVSRSDPRARELAAFLFADPARASTRLQSIRLRLRRLPSFRSRWDLLVQVGLRLLGRAARLLARAAGFRSD